MLTWYRLPLALQIGFKHIGALGSSQFLSCFLPLFCMPTDLSVKAFSLWVVQTCVLRSPKICLLSLLHRSSVLLAALRLAAPTYTWTDLSIPHGNFVRFSTNYVHHPGLEIVLFQAFSYMLNSNVGLRIRYISVSSRLQGQTVLSLSVKSISCLGRPRDAFAWLHFYQHYSPNAAFPLIPFVCIVLIYTALSDVSVSLLWNLL